MLDGERLIVVIEPSYTMLTQISCLPRVCLIPTSNADAVTDACLMLAISKLVVLSCVVSIAVERGLSLVNSYFTTSVMLSVCKIIDGLARAKESRESTYSPSFVSPGLIRTWVGLP